MPFTLEKPYRTRNGRRAWAVRSPEAFNHGYLYIGWYALSDRTLEHASWREGGAFYSDSESDFDLVNVPERHTGWVAVYTAYAQDVIFGRLPFHLGNIYPTREAVVEAYKYTVPPFAIVKIEFEDERGGGK